MNTTPPNNGPRSNGSGSNGPGSNGPGDGAGSGSGDSANQDPRWDAFKDGQPEGDRPFNANNPYAQRGGDTPVAQSQPGAQPAQPNQTDQQGGAFGQVNNGGQNPYGQNPQGAPGQPQQPRHQQPGEQGMNAQPGTPNATGGPAGPNGPGGVEQKGKKGNTGALIAAAIGVVLILGIGTFVACQPGDDEEDAAAETSQTQAADTSSEKTTESSEDTATEETSESEGAEGTEDRDPSKGRPAGTVPFDELEDGDEITLGEGLGPGQEWGTYDGKIIAVPESVDNPGGPSDDLELAKQHAVYYAYQDLKSRAVVTHRLTDTSARYMQTFTPEVAEKAVEESDIDWNAIALVEAKKYKERWPDDPDDRLFGVLVEEDEFTEKEAQYAMDHLNR